MNKKMAMKWVKALRSGEYEQCQGVLQNDYGRFCCLGVLCDINGQSTEGDAGYTYLETILKDQLGGLGRSVRLSSLNDSGFNDVTGQWINQRLTFDEIADIIQIDYKEL